MMQERRTSKRQHCKQPGMILSLVGSPIHDCVVIDISAKGACLLVGIQEVIPDYFRLNFGDNRVQPKCRVRWRRGFVMGVEFFR